MKVAVLIDGAFLRKKYKQAFKQNLTPHDTEKFVKRSLEFLGFSAVDYRAYFYECRPCGKKTQLPVSKKEFCFDSTPQFRDGNALLDGIAALDYFAVREGQIMFSGWALRKKCYDQQPHTDDSFAPCLSQKGVDMKIGLDVAWISYEKTFDRIVLVTADSDFIPAIKVARRGGIFVHLLTLNHGVMESLSKNADVTRSEPLPQIMLGLPSPTRPK